MPETADLASRADVAATLGEADLHSAKAAS